MAEAVIVRQNSRFEIQIDAIVQHDHEHEHRHANQSEPEFQPISDIRYLTPYGMLLASLGSCTTVVLHTYAQNHGVELDEAEVRVSYDRVFADDCEDCEEIDEFHERIDVAVALTGQLSASERTRLHMIARHCSIHKMLEQGIEVRTVEWEDA